jgi:hypothetical protein
MEEPSPITPDGPADGFYAENNQFFAPALDKDMSMKYPFPATANTLTGPYPLMPQQTTSLPYHPALVQRLVAPQASQPVLQPQQPPSPPPAESSGSNAAQKGKKDKYPCPLSKQYNCTDTFTTSGHAARHAKKHTGVRDAECPECGKTFTRKDNMEQHRKTHQNGRGGSKGSSDDSKIRRSSKASTKRPRPSPIQAAAVEAPIANFDLQPQMAISTSPVAQLVTPQQPLPPYQPPSQDFAAITQPFAYPDPANFALNQAPAVPIVAPHVLPYDTASAAGLNALAKAAQFSRGAY